MAFVTRLRPRNPIKPGGYIYMAIMFALHPAAEIPVKTNVFPPPNAISLFPPFYFRPMRWPPRSWCVYIYYIDVLHCKHKRRDHCTRTGIWRWSQWYKGGGADGGVRL